MNHDSRTVSITHVEDYDNDRMLEAVRRHFAALRLSEKLRPEMRVLIKPNLLLKRRPEEATTTHPAMIRAIILCLKECGVHDIVLAESPGGPYTAATLGPIYEASGLRAVAEETGVELNLDTSSFERERLENVLVRRFTLIKPLEHADFVIDAAKLKTHGMMMLSGGVKNLFGTVPGLMKPEFHFRFPEREPFGEMLVDLCETVSPDVTFVDAVDSMEGDGPSAGSPRHTGMVLAAENPYVLDRVLCDVVHLPYTEVSTVTASLRRGYLPESREEIECVGDPLRTFADFAHPKSKSLGFDEHIPGFLRKPIKKLLTTRPVVRQKNCVGCGKCAESCPMHTIEIIDRKAHIHAEQCIRCFCCHEMCPIKAIDIKRFNLFRF